jgi:hypothetical protein
MFIRYLIVMIKQKWYIHFWIPLISDLLISACPPWISACHLSAALIMIVFQFIYVVTII